MRVLSELSALCTQSTPIFMASGFFDGVHRGHRRVIEESVSRARAVGGEAWVLTFDTHPIKVLRPADAPRLLTSPRHKLRLLSGAGVDGCLLLNFTPEFASLEPREFVDMLCNSVSGLREISVGENWRFGKSGRGDPSLLRELLSGRNVSARTVSPVLWKGTPISSSWIRNCVASGNLEDAAAMLGRPFEILGTVVKGRGIGRELGFPTANLDTENEVQPPGGVYAVCANIGGRRRPGVLNIGTRPTFGGDGADGSRTIEMHLPGVDMDLYGLDIDVLFLEKLRDERKFDSREALEAQIANDVQAMVKVYDAWSSKL